MPSLKCMFFDKWLHKGQINQDEYNAAIKKLDGHDKQLLEDLNKFLIEEKGKYIGSDIDEFLAIRKVQKYEIID